MGNIAVKDKKKQNLSAIRIINVFSRGELFAKKASKRIHAFIYTQKYFSHINTSNVNTKSSLPYLLATKKQRHFILNSRKYRKYDVHLFN